MWQLSALSAFYGGDYLHKLLQVVHKAGAWLDQSKAQAALLELFKPFSALQFGII